MKYDSAAASAQKLIEEMWRTQRDFRPVPFTRPRLSVNVRRIPVTLICSPPFGEVFEISRASLLITESNWSTGVLMLSTWVPPGSRLVVSVGGVRQWLARCEMVTRAPSSSRVFSAWVPVWRARIRQTVTRPMVESV